MQADPCTVHVQATCAAVPVQPCLCIRAGAVVFVQLWLRYRAGAAVSLQPCHCQHLGLGSSAAFVVSVAVVAVGSCRRRCFALAVGMIYANTHTSMHA